MKKMLVAIDSPAASTDALVWATALAAPLGADLVVAHVYAAEPSGEQDWASAHRSQFLEVEEWCRLPIGRGVAAIPALLDGETGPALVSAAEEFDVGLIVLNRRRDGTIEGLVVGGAADHVAHHSNRALAVLPPGTPRLAPAKIVLGVDGSDDSMEAAAWLVPIAAALSAEVTVVEAAAPPDLLARLTTARLVAAQGVLDRSKAIFDRDGLDVTLRLLEGTPAADGLMAVAADTGADAVVIGTRGVGGLRRLRVGGVTMRLLHHCPVPVIAVPRVG